MSGLLSLSGTKAANDLKVNVVNTSNINLNADNKTCTSSQSKFPKTAQKAATEYPSDVEVIQPTTREVQVDYSEANPYANLSSTDTSTQTTEDIAKLKNENEALKIIIGIIQNNPFYVNKFIVADDVKLMELVKLLCNADDVQMDADDLGQGCITKNTYRKVHAIYVIKDGNTKNLKYDYPGVVKELTELGVSTKFVY